ncbi:MAG: hypothetical protein R3D67_05555 [Hyphomicrobiaceae bacterium]
MAQASEPPTLMVIFDGSGSMWGTLEGDRRSKLAMTRDALKESLGLLPQQTRIGLASFGYRRSGDCSDAGVLLKPEKLDVDRFMAPLDKLNPKGRGPVTRALREVVGELGPQSAPADVLVIHDGLDNCQQDPCSTVGELRTAHPGVRVHVMSLGLPEEEAKQMACLPQQTGGKHFIAANAEATLRALQEVMRSVGRRGAAPANAAASAGSQPVAPPVERRVAIPAGRPGLQLTSRLVKGGPTLGLAIDWIVRAGDGKGPPLWQGRATAPLLALPTGRYTVQASAGLVTRTAVAEAVQGKPRAFDVVLNAGTLVLATSKAGERMLDDTILSLSRIEGSGVAAPQLVPNPDSEIVLPQGNYLLAVTSGTLRIERPIGIVAGSRISIANALALGEVTLSALAAKGGKPLDSVVYAIYEDDPDAPQGRREVARSAGSNPRFKLPSGTYFVIARRGAAETRDRITVRAGEAEKRQLVLDAGQIALSVALPGGLLAGRGPIAHRLERIGGAPGEALHASGASALLDATAGRYRIDSRVGLGNVKSTREITLKPGEVEQVVIEQPAGAVNMQVVDRIGGRAIADVSWEIRDQTGKDVWVGVGTHADALLLAGRYAVKVEARGRRTERSIDVKAGEAKNYELTLR